MPTLEPAKITPGPIDAELLRRLGPKPKRKFRLDAVGEIQGGRITIYREPKIERRYSLGLDFAFGVEGGDFDAGVMLDDTGEQAATIHGHWGAGFEEILYPVLDWFDPFIVGERTATGLPILQRFYRKRYWVYFERNEESRGNADLDKLGHRPTQSDITIHELRRAIGTRNDRGELEPPKVIIHDGELIGQLMKFGFRPRSARVEPSEARDAQLIWGAPAGEHDDLVRAGALAWFGLKWLPAYEPPKVKYAEGTIGHVLGHDRQEPDRRNIWAKTAKVRH